ncbi:MAG TPA: hypothetical protein VFU21_19540, partial [Kofleriaceae bacterium]|nr:hypothetical protein [Kofleriaceae bacterium]
MSLDPVSLGQNLALLDEMYARFQADPGSVDPVWRELFINGQAPDFAARPAPGAAAPAAPAPARPAAGPPELVNLDLSPRVYPLVIAYRAFGHKAAQLDPLGLLERPPAPELDPSYHGFT